MSKTQTIILVTVLVVVLGLAIGAKLLFFPSVKDTDFAPTRGTLQKVRAGLTVIRPTHFPLHRETVTYASVKDGTWRLSGRNVPLRDLIAIAYEETGGRVDLPPDAPTNAFDFVATTRDPRASLQKVIHDTLHYTADKETNDTDVLALKIVDPTLPGMTPCAPDEKGSAPSFKKGKVTLNHILLKDFTRGFEQVIKTPVVDKTGLTNYYDVTFDWTQSMGSRLQNPTTGRPILDKILKGWGLALEPDTASIEMLEVKKVY